MSNEIVKNTNAVLLIPPIIATFIITAYQGNWLMCYLIFILSFFVWVILLGLGFFVYFIFKPKIDKSLRIEIMEGLNISKKEWNKISTQDKLKLHYYLLGQERLKRSIVYKKLEDAQNKIKSNKKLLDFHKNKFEYIKIFEIEVNNYWGNLSLNQKIEAIDKNDIEQEEVRKQREIDLVAEKILQKEKLKKIEEEKALIAEQERIKKTEEDRKKEEEKVKKNNLDREERIKIEAIKKEELLIEQKKRLDEEYKNRIKFELLEKERRKSIESEAIQELLDAGLIDNNHYTGKNIRESIPTDVKVSVWKRDKERCVNCFSNTNLEFDHIIPVSKGGANSIKNIQLLCRNCNRTKSNKIM